MIKYFSFACVFFSSLVRFSIRHTMANAKWNGPLHCMCANGYTNGLFITSNVNSFPCLRSSFVSCVCVCVRVDIHVHIAMVQQTWAQTHIHDCIAHAVETRASQSLSLSAECALNVSIVALWHGHWDSVQVNNMCVFFFSHFFFFAYNIFSFASKSVKYSQT